MPALWLKKPSQIQCGCSSILPDTLATRARSTWLARAQFHNRSLADPHTKQATAQTPPLLHWHEPIRFGVGPPERERECPKHGAFACSHGTHLHVAA